MPAPAAVTVPWTRVRGKPREEEHAYQNTKLFQALHPLTKSSARCHAAQKKKLLFDEQFITRSSRRELPIAHETGYASPSPWG
jgi:hypothetical protein